jgi:hypothetical protein
MSLNPGVTLPLEGGKATVLFHGPYLSHAPKSGATTSSHAVVGLAGENAVSASGKK